MIVSSWENSDLSLLEGKDLSGVEVVLTSPDHPDTTFNRYNTWYHCKSTLEGLKKAQELGIGYSIKTRADNFIGLKEFKLALEHYSNRYICTNLYFRPDVAKEFKFHASDQTIASLTSHLYNCFEVGVRRCEQYSQLCVANMVYFSPRLRPQVITNASEKRAYAGLSPDQLITSSFIVGKGIELDLMRSSEIMKKNFYIIPLESIHPYIGSDGTSNIPYSGPQINSLEEL